MLRNIREFLGRDQALGKVPTARKRMCPTKPSRPISVHRRVFEVSAPVCHHNRRADALHVGVDLPALDVEPVFFVEPALFHISP